MPETLSFCVPAEADGERLDKWLSGQEESCDDAFRPTSSYGAR